MLVYGKPEHLTIIATLRQLRLKHQSREGRQADVERLASPWYILLVISSWRTVSTVLSSGV